MKKNIFLIFACFIIFSCNNIQLDISTNSSFETLISKNKLSAFVFLSPECPLSENYTSVINTQRKLFTNKSVTFYTVFPGTFYSKKKITIFLEKYHLKNKVIYDENYFLTKKLKATITPEVVLLDSTETVIYGGAIDNWAISLGRQRTQTTEKYLKNAIENYFAGTKITPQKTEAIGCIIE